MCPICGRAVSLEEGIVHEGRRVHGICFLSFLRSLRVTPKGRRALALYREGVPEREINARLTQEGW